MGLIDYDRCLALQQRLVDDAVSRADRHAVVLLCEHSNVISVGRGGSWAHLRHNQPQLSRENVGLRWSNRGGGCQLHLPGQLAVYPIVPLDAIGWNVGEYLRRLGQALEATCDDVRVDTHRQAPSHGLWARGGQVATVGAAIKHGVSYHGAQLNVEPDLRRFQQYLRVDASQRPSSLATESRSRPSMSRVRSCLMDRLAEAFDCERLDIHTGHPLLRHAAVASTSEVAGVV
jgi:lipoyl(octanoyl) transferase